jgi:predicted nucleic acid-binding protein
MSGKTLLDTNILVYAIERFGPNAAKSQTARELVRRPGVCISTQVLGEFYSATTSKRRASPLNHREAVAWIQFFKRLDVLTITVAHVDLALQIVSGFGIGYYDALILATARLGECVVVQTEDLSHDQDYGGVRASNPFVADVAEG